MSTLKKITNTALFAAFAVAAGGASAQNYPTRPVRIIVPTSAGAHSDFAARLISQTLTQRLGQQVIVDNRAGGGTIIGSDIVAKSPPDGHTLLMGGPSLAINPAVYKKIPYDALQDFAPITQAINQSLILMVHPSLPAKSVKELIVLAKARPGEIIFASPGTGSGPHLSMELFLVMTGTRMLHVPYKGPAQAIIDLTAGRLSVMMLSTGGGSPHVRAGRLRALGVSGTRRGTTMPDIPTIAEAGVPGYETEQWAGLLAPAGTPHEIVVRLHKEVTAILNAQDVRERLAKEDIDVVARSPEEFTTYIRAETTKWAKVVKAAGIKPE